MKRSEGEMNVEGKGRERRGEGRGTITREEWRESGNWGRGEERDCKGGREGG